MIELRVSYSMMSIFFSLGGLEGNILKYTISLITNKRIFIAVLGAYYLTVPGVTPAWIGIILLVSNLVGFLFEIPSGYISDKMGHKQALVLSSLSMVMSTVFFLFAHNVALLILGGILMSISHAFHSGTGHAFMQETLKALGKDSQYREIMGKMSSIGFAVPIVLMVVTPFLVSISWRLPFAVALIFDVIGLIVVSSFVVPNVPQQHIDEVRSTNFVQVMREGYRLHFFRHAIFSGVLMGILFSVGVFRAVYQDVLGIPVLWYGVFFGIGRAMASLLLWQSGRIQRRFGNHPTHLYILKLVLFVGLLLVLGLSQTPWIVVIAFILINAFQWGLSSVGHSMEVINESKFKATLISVKAQIQELVAGVASFFLGFFVAQASFPLAFLTFAGILMIILLPLLYFIATDTRHRVT